jgi:hypothetical protein
MDITHEEYLELQSRDKSTLTPAEFLKLWRYENQSKQVVHSSRYGNTAEELYEVFKEDIKAHKSPNQFKLAVGRAGLSISHGRARTLFPLFKQRLIDNPEQTMIEGNNDE